MLKFKDYKYERPNMESLKDNFSALIKEFNSAETFEKQDEIMKNINELRSDFESMMELVMIRHTIDTTDEFYAQEQDFVDENMPHYEGTISEYNKALVESKFRAQLEEKWGKQLFTLAEMALKTFEPEIIEDLQQENKLISEYTKLSASAKIMFEGEERNLSQLGPFVQSKDRDMRKRASEAVAKFFEGNESEFDRIYDELVKVRTGIAKKLGYKNFVELGYARMLRSDYNAEMVANYRKQVLEYIVPVAGEQKAKKEKKTKRKKKTKKKTNQKNKNLTLGLRTEREHYGILVEEYWKVPP
jgi:M3 family oligoendopeptidase